MTVNGLRLGNWVSLKGIEYTIAEIDRFGGIRLMDKRKLGTTPYYDEDILPIQLTEDILRKIDGFVITRDGAHKIYNEFGNIFKLNKVKDKYYFTWGDCEIGTLH